MEYNAVLNRVRPMLTNGNHLSAQGFEALFGSCSQQEQEHLLAELAVIGILVDTSAAIPSSRKAASFCRSDFTSKQLWSMTNEQLWDRIEEYFLGLPIQGFDAPSAESR